VHGRTMAVEAVLRSTELSVSLAVAAQVEFERKS